MTVAITYVSAIGSGLGDVVLCLPVRQKLIEARKNVVLVTRSFRQEGISERIAGIKGEISEELLSLNTDDSYINLRAHPLQTDHTWGTPEFEAFFGGPSNMEQIVQRISADFGIEFSYEELSPLKFRKLEELSNTVALIPGSDGFYKHWPHEYWMRLNSEITGLGLKTVVLGKENESPPVSRLLKAGLPHLNSPGIAEAIDIVSSCKMVVSVDTGLMHIAVNQGLPTIAFIHPINFHTRTAANCINFRSQRFCPRECREKMFDLAPEQLQAKDYLSVEIKFERQECKLPIEENCMAKIKPEDVFDELKKLFS